MPSWFKAQADGRTATVVIDKAIGSDWAPDWVAEWTGEETAREFIDCVESFGELDTIDLTLNSPGGDVFGGVRIMNYLKNHRATVNIRVDGMAASIATVILMAGDTRTMGIGSMLMVHNPASWMGGYYTESEMRETADYLAKVTDAVVDAYVAGTDKSAEEIKELLDKGDSYLTATDSIEWGFATAKDESLKAVANADMSMYQGQFKAQAQINALEAVKMSLEDKLTAEMEVTERLKAEVAEMKTPVTLCADAVFQMCDDAQLSDMAAQMLRDKVTIVQAEHRIKTASVLRDIEAAAGVDGLTQHAADPVAAVRTLALQLKNRNDEINPHCKVTSDGGVMPVDSDATYDQLNKRSVK